VSRADSDPGEVVVRAADDQAQSREWAVVLQAAGVPCRVERSREGWGVIVASGDAPAARDALAAYDAEALRAGDDDVVEYGPTSAGVLMALALWGVALVTGFRAGGKPLFLAGEADAAKIIAGQPWRAVTALLLHADFVHLAGNVAAIIVLGTAVCRLLGPGLGLALMVTSGTIGNLMNAYLRKGQEHVSIGASTAIFGAVGILAGLAIMRARPQGRRLWVPFAAGIALLALLGTGEHADLAAHFFGFQMGLGFGLAMGVVLDRPPGPRAQRWLVAATVAIVVGAWVLAARTIGR